MCKDKCILIKNASEKISYGVFLGRDENNYSTTQTLHHTKFVQDILEVCPDIDVILETKV